MKPYQPSWAYEDVTTTDLSAQLGMTRDQRYRAATMLYVWTRAGAAAGLGSDLSNWPAGDPVRLICDNIIEHDARTGQRQTPSAGDLPATLYGLIAEWHIAPLPSPRQAEAIEQRIRDDLNHTAIGQNDDDQVA